MNQVLLKGGIACLEEGLKAVDIRIVGQYIEQIGPGLQSNRPSCEVVDCTGLFILPGLIDMHVHVDDTIGENSLADDWQTASIAAIQTGLTTLIGFATQAEHHSISHTARQMISKAAGRSFCDYALHLTPTKWNDETWQELGDLRQQGFATLKLYTTYRENGLYSSYQGIQRIMKVSRRYGFTVLLHCEDDDMLNRAGKAYRGDPTLPISHALKRPPEAEIRAIRESIRICRQTKSPMHIVHVSTSAGAELLRQAAAHCPVTFETCPQYLLLSETQLQGQDGHRHLCSPPLRQEQDRVGLLESVNKGKVDVLATDHCPFDKSVKDRAKELSVEQVPKGLPGVGSLVPLAREILIHDPTRHLPNFVNMLSTNPARICGLDPQKGSLDVGKDADLVIADLFAEPSTVRSSLSDVYEPYRQTLSRFLARRVYLRGALVVQDGAVSREQSPRGIFACPK